MSITARPTYYRGTLLRSRLEAAAAAMLDNLFMRKWQRDAWNQHLLHYEGHAFANRRHNYLPDFVINWPNDITTFFEVKPDKLSSAEVSSCLERMHCIRDTFETAELVVLVGSWVGHAYDYDFVWRACIPGYDGILLCSRCRGVPDAVSPPTPKVSGPRVALGALRPKEPDDNSWVGYSDEPF